MRVGIGWDIHRLEIGLPLVVGGVRIPHDRGAVGHSDGDALVHAVADALLGAAGLGDIGEHFSDDDPEWEGVSSADAILPAACRLVAARALAVASVDATVILERPHLSEFKAQIRARLARAIGIDAERVNVKAKSGEGQGQVGRNDAIVAHAIALLEPAEKTTAG